MTESPHAQASPTNAPPRRRLGRLLVYVPAVVLALFTIGTAAGLFVDRAAVDPVARTPVELGGIEWRTIDIEPSSTGQGFTIRASVDDARLDGADANDDSPYVLWMLGTGTYDDRPWTDSWKDEEQLGMSHDEQLSIIPVGAGEYRYERIDTGTYTPSVDGSITYDRIPAGEYQLRALVMRDGGLWDGTLASRTIRVE